MLQRGGVAMKQKFYRLTDRETGLGFITTLPNIIKEINRDRSDEWQDYDESDWREGLAEFTEYDVEEL